MFFYSLNQIMEVDNVSYVKNCGFKPLKKFN